MDILFLYMDLPGYLLLLFANGYKFPELFTVKVADGVTDLYGENVESVELYSNLTGITMLSQPFIASIRFASS